MSASPIAKVQPAVTALAAARLHLGECKTVQFPIPEKTAVVELGGSRVVVDRSELRLIGPHYRAGRSMLSRTYKLPTITCEGSRSSRRPRAAAAPTRRSPAERPNEPRNTGQISRHHVQ